MSEDDFLFYTCSCAKMERNYVERLARMGVSSLGADWFASVLLEDLDSSIVWYWQFLCGFWGDLKEAAALEKQDRKGFLQVRAEQRIKRLTKEYRQCEAFVRSL